MLAHVAASPAVQQKAQDLVERLPGNGDVSPLEGDAAAMADDLGAGTCGSAGVVPRADNLTLSTSRLAADDPTIVAQFCVQVRKIAIRITMTAITTMPAFVSVTNVRYICS
jgi:hypothetical protein